MKDNNDEPKLPEDLPWEKARELIHLLGGALEAKMLNRPGMADFARLAMHEYHHFCFGRGDFGSDVIYGTMRKLIEGRCKS